jgi:hypothetical protein
MPAVKLIKIPALAAEAPDPGCREMKYAPRLMDYSSAILATLLPKIRAISG